LLDKVEKMVGQWTPGVGNPRYSTIWQAVDSLSEQSDVLEDKQQVDLIASKAKELNKDLDSLVNRFRNERAIYYDHNKIDFLYSTTERSFECDKLAEIVIDRLRALE
jgi:hypothetical protein